MLLSKKEFDENWNKLRPIALELQKTYLSAPPEAKKLYTAHGNMSLLFSYAYYVGIVKKYANMDSIVLDWGGLYGQVCRLLEVYFPGRTVCYLPEIDKNIEYWHNKFKISNVIISKNKESVAKINIRDGSVHVVVSSGVLEHTYEYGVNDVDALKEIYRILIHDGLLIIWNLPAKHAASDLINKMAGRYYHLKRYSKDEIYQLLALCGFEVINFESHEILLSRVRSIVGKIFGEKTAFYIDHFASRLPMLSIFRQQITVIAKKKEGYLFSPSYDGRVCN